MLQYADLGILYPMAKNKKQNKDKKKIHIGADHRGYCLKYSIKQYLAKKGYEVIDHGNHQFKSTDDFPVYAKKVCQAIVKDNYSVPGILICGSGVGMDIMANKTPGLRAAICWNSKVAVAARHDDNPHVLVLPADFITTIEANKTVGKFLSTPFSHKNKNKRRLKQIDKYEKC